MVEHRQGGRGGLGRVLSYAGLGLATGSAAVGGHMSYAQSSGASHATTAARGLDHDWIDLGPLDDLPEGRPALRTGPGNDVPVPLVHALEYVAQELRRQAEHGCMTADLDGESPEDFVCSVGQRGEQFIQDLDDPSSR